MRKSELLAAYTKFIDVILVDFVKMRLDGRTNSEIERVTGIPERSIWWLARTLGLLPRDERPKRYYRAKLEEFETVTIATFTRIYRAGKTNLEITELSGVPRCVIPWLAKSLCLPRHKTVQLKRNGKRKRKNYSEATIRRVLSLCGNDELSFARIAFLTGVTESAASSIYRKSGLPPRKKGQKRGAGHLSNRYWLARYKKQRLAIVVDGYVDPETALTISGLSRSSFCSLNRKVLIPKVETTKPISPNHLFDYSLRHLELIRKLRLA